jgi:hypothetical protein
VEELDGDLDAEQDSGFKSVDLKGAIKAAGTAETEPEAEDTAADKAEPEAEEGEDVANADEGEKAAIDSLEAKPSDIVIEMAEVEPEDKVDYSLLD